MWFEYYSGSHSFPHSNWFILHAVNQGPTPQQQKNDVFVGNLAFNTTEEQLHQIFSEIGRVVKVRMVTDLETGKPRGFAFVEFEDPQAALAAIRNMNEYELNGRSLRVNFSNSSHLESLATKLGMDMSHTQRKADTSAGTTGATDIGAGTTTIADALRVLSKAEMYNIISQFKAVADKDPDEARKLLCAHPQLPEAVLHLMSKLEMLQTPLGLSDLTSAAVVTQLPQQPTAASVQISQQVVDPRLRAAAAPADPRMAAPQPPTADPRAAIGVRSDPRASLDPRYAAAQQPPVPPPPMMSVPPPTMLMQQPQVALPPASVASLDPALIQQVLSLTPQQIAQLPPDKQQSILALKFQLTGGR